MQHLYLHCSLAHSICWRRWNAGSKLGKERERNNCGSPRLTQGKGEEPTWTGSVKEGWFSTGLGREAISRAGSK